MCARDGLEVIAFEAAALKIVCNGELLRAFEWEFIKKSLSEEIV